MSKNKDLTKEIKKAAGEGDISSLMGMLNEKDKEVFSSLLNDKKARDELLGSREARLIIEKFLGGR